MYIEHFVVMHGTHFKENCHSQKRPCRYILCNAYRRDAITSIALHLAKYCRQALQEMYEKVLRTGRESRGIGKVVYCVDLAEFVCLFIFIVCCNVLSVFLMDTCDAFYPNMIASVNC